MINEIVPLKVLSLLQDDKRSLLLPCYLRMREINREIRQGKKFEWTIKEIALPGELKTCKKSSFVWALLYIITFHPILFAIGIFSFPFGVFSVACKIVDFVAFNMGM